MKDIEITIKYRNKEPFWVECKDLNGNAINPPHWLLEKFVDEIKGATVKVFVDYEEAKKEAKKWVGSTGTI